MDRKYFIGLLAGTLLVLFTACGSKKTEKTDTDSVSVLTEEQQTFDSPDLMWKDLTGNVEYVTVSTVTEGNPRIQTVDSIRFTLEGRLQFLSTKTNYGGDWMDEIRSAFIYDKDGNLKTATDKADHQMQVEVDRDEYGRITNYRRVDRNAGMDSELAFEERYLWDENDRVKRYELQGYEWGSSKTFTYDDEGRLVKATERSSDIGVETVSEETYEYVSTDAEGNWTERIVTIKRTISEEEAGQPVREKLTRKEKRSIKYYK